MNSIWLLYFVNAFQSTLLGNLIPYVTSDFSSQSLLNVVTIVADSMSAASYIPLAKILDTWGRAEGFFFMALLCTLGLIMMAACKNLETFCAAYVSLHAHQQIRLRLIIGFLGFLHSWLWRYNLLCRRGYCWCIQVKEPSFGLCLHVFAIHYYRIRSFKSIWRI